MRVFLAVEGRSLRVLLLGGEALAPAARRLADAGAAVAWLEPPAGVGDPRLTPVQAWPAGVNLLVLEGEPPARWRERVEARRAAGAPVVRLDRGGDALLPSVFPFAGGAWALHLEGAAPEAEEAWLERLAGEWGEPSRRYAETLARVEREILGGVEDRDFRAKVLRSAAASGLPELLRAGETDKALALVLKIIGSTTRNL